MKPEGPTAEADLVMLRRLDMKMAVACLAVLLLQAAPSWAVLGQPVASVSSDQQRMRGEMRSVAHQGYSVQQIKAPDGDVVKEYVSPTGVVFAVSWQTRTMPNLQQLFGSYFAQFQQASEAKTRRRRGVVVRTNQLVVESGGHMRAFHGRAYVPALLPPNVPLTDIQ
jgi:Protein of unknown function (DUF2844)